MLFKLSHEDGHVVWQSVQRFGFDGSPLWSGMIVLAGEDAIVSGPYFDGSDTPALRYVDGATGATRWTSNVFGADDIAAVRRADGGILVVGNGDGWAQLDKADGSAHWTGPAYSSSCGNACLENRGIVLPGGDLLVIGEGGYQAQVSRLAGDGSGTFQNWTLVPDNGPVRSQATDIRIDASGIWLNLLHGNRSGPGGLSVLAKFDAATGTLVSQQVIRSRPGGLVEPVTYGGWLGNFDGGRLLINSIAANAPFATASGNAVIDTTITGHGDLALTLGVARPGSGPLGVSAHVTYTGDAPVTGVHIDIYLPRGAGARDVACAVVAASGCTIDTRDGNLLARVDLAPGAAVDLTAQVAPLASSGTAPMLSGVVFGPMGLDESDTLNNLAQASMAPDEVFAGGFDGN
jgi:hypothetical protein